MKGQRLPDEAISFLAFVDAQLEQGRQRIDVRGTRGNAHSAQPTSTYAEAGSPRSAHIQEALMKKHRLAQMKITSLKAELQAQELQTLLPAPAINPLSRKLAESMPRPRLYPVASKSDPKKKPQKPDSKPNDSENTLSILTASKSEGMIQQTQTPFQLRCHVNLEQGTTSPVFPAMRAGKDDDLRVCAKGAIASIETLRKEVMERYQEKGKLQPPPDLLEMPVLARQDFFLEQRSRKLQLQREILAEAEASLCTFRPNLTSRSLSTSRSEKSCRSLSAPRRPRTYYERYVNSKTQKDVLNHTTSNVHSESAENQSKRTVKSCFSSLYVPLSPTQQRVSFKAGMNFSAFIEHAKPMVSYRNIDIRKAIEGPRAGRRGNRH